MASRTELLKFENIIGNIGLWIYYCFLGFSCASPPTIVFTS